MKLAINTKEKTKLRLKSICFRCDKPLIGANPNVITSWIFSLNTCKCPALDLVAEDEGTQAGDSATCPEIDDRLEVLGLIGQGAMGQVYKVRDKDLDKVFAAKVLRPEFGQDEARMKRFRQEAIAASDLTHANLVSVYYNKITKTGAPYLVMDYIEGESLDRILKEEVYLDVPRALNIFIQSCQAMVHAHMKGVIHRDLKPSNIIISPVANGSENVRIVDFGIAKLIDRKDNTSNFTRTGDILGTALYISPEQCKGETVGARSDIYSFGCVMYEMLTGRPPFVGSNPIKIIMKHLEEEPKPLKQPFGTLDIPDALEAVVLKCIEKDANKRYQSAQDLLLDLESVQAGRRLVVWKGNLGRQMQRRQSHHLPRIFWVMIAVAYVSSQLLGPNILGPPMGWIEQLGFSIPFVWFPLSLVLLVVFARKFWNLRQHFHSCKEIKAGDRWLLPLNAMLTIDLAVLSFLLFFAMLIGNHFSPYIGGNLSLAFLSDLPALVAWAAVLIIGSPVLFAVIWLWRKSSKSKPASSW